MLNTNIAILAELTEKFKDLHILYCEGKDENKKIYKRKMLYGYIKTVNQNNTKSKKYKNS